VGAITLDLSHQIKNPLYIVLGRLESLLDRMKAGSEEQRYLDIAMRSAHRIRDLTQTFAS